MQNSYFNWQFSETIAREVHFICPISSKNLNCHRLKQSTEDHTIEAPSPTLLQVEHLCFSTPQRELFSHLSLRIPPGITLVRGDEACGKTTLLRLFAGELPAQSGDFQLNGAPLKTSLSTYQQQVFWADPRSQVWEQTSSADYFQSLPHRYPQFDAQRATELAEGLGLTPHLEKPLYMLSTGSKRKVWLAAAFASGATVTLLDEPFSALDKPSIRFVLALLREGSQHPKRAWVVADYEAPEDVTLAAIIELGA